MRTNLIPIGVIAIVLLLSSKKSSGQVTDTLLFRTTHIVLPLSSIKKDSLSLISLNKTLKKNTASLAPLNGISGSSTLTKQLNKFTDNKSLLEQFKLPLDFKSPILNLNKANIFAQFNNSAVSAESLEGYASQSVYISSNAAVLGIPLSIGYSTNSGWENDINPLSFSTAKFDKDKFLEQIKEKIKKVANPEELFSGALSQLYAKRDQAISTIKNELSGVLKNGNAKLLKTVMPGINSENISRQGVDQFLNNIIAENISTLTEKQNSLLHLQNINRMQAASTDSANLLLNEIGELNKSKELLQNEIEVLRNKWFKNGVLEIVNGFEKEKQSVISKLFNNPEAIIKIASEKLNLPGLQKMLLNVKSLNIGAAGINQGKLGLDNALLKGLSLESLKGQRFFAPVFGTQPGVKNFSDQLYSNFNELPNILTAALRMGKGDPQKDFSHVSVSLFQPTNNQQFLPTGLQTALPKNLVTTFSKRVSFGASQSLLTEISKSTSLYNQASGGTEGAAKSILNSDNLLGNMGINLGYTGEFADLGLSENLTVRYSGKEYSNLGSYSLVSGTKEISNNVRKYFLNRKLIVSVKVHYREYDFSVDDRKWKSFSYMTDLKWKMKKGEFLEVRYQPYFNRRTTVSENYLSSKSHRIAVRGNVNRKIGKGFTYRNFIELASSKDNYYDILLDKFNSNNSISFTSLQTLVLGSQTLFVNLTGNHAKQNTGYLFGNSSLSIDGGMTFTPAKNIFLSSALVYNEVSKMYSQLAIRQSISTQLGKNLMIEGFIHAGKNLYEQGYLHIPAVTGNLSISYNLK